MRLRLLGTGDAIGTPRVGCSCPQCLHARDSGLQRLRTSFLIEQEGKNILVESGPDLRQQLLLCGSPHIDAVLWTHGHYDHFMGFGEFYRVQKMPEAYAPPPVLDYCSGIFRFLSFGKHPVQPHRPFLLHGVEFTFFPVPHPPAYTCGLHISVNGKRIGYTSDSRADIPEESLDYLRDVDLLLIDALVPPDYHISKHMNYQEACTLARELRAKEFRCVHMSHHLSWDLPNLGHDGELFCLSH